MEGKMADEHPLISEFRAFAPTSAALARRARKVFPGGDTRASAHYAPFPLVMDHASGCRLTDVDGNELLDFMNNFTSLIHGHAHPAVVDAIQAQAPRGSAYAAPNLAQIELAELIAHRVPSVELMRFTSSGTEGTLMAIRCARAATGRQKIMKMEGGYHGSYELAEVSLVPFPDGRGGVDAPSSQPVDASFPASVLADTVICPYNEPDHARRLIDRHADELAAVIVEPVLGSMGMIPANTAFLRTLREATAAHGIVLVFDEVITLRLDAGGAQQIHGIRPDLTCMGKIIGGGLPIGAVGGSRDLMEQFNPDREQPVMHASTFSGNALTMAAGLAAMRAYDGAEAARLNRLGERLRTGFNEAFLQAGIRGQAVGSGSLTNLHFTDAPLNDARDSLAGMTDAGHIPRLLHLGMLRRGIMSASRLMNCVSTAMTDTEVDTAIGALNETLRELRPHLESERPALLTAAG
jgi:glutamate-1-semialdehyde 2,1-aminomutase